MRGGREELVTCGEVAGGWVDACSSWALKRSRYGILGCGSSVHYQQSSPAVEVRDILFDRLTLASFINCIKREIFTFLGQPDQRKQDVEFAAPQTIRIFLLTRDDKIEYFGLVCRIQPTAGQ